MKTYINTKTNSYFNMNINKLLMLLGLLILSLVSVNASTQVISTCPVSISNNTEYILTNNFFATSTPCFTLNNTQNVTINGNFTNRVGLGNIVIDVYSNNLNLQIKNIYSDGLLIDWLGINNNLDFNNNVIINGYGLLYTGTGSGFPNTNLANIIFNYQAPAGSAGVTNNQITLRDNRFQAPTIIAPQNDNYVVFFFQSTFYGLSLDIENNNFIGWTLGSQQLQNNGGAGVGNMYLEQLYFSNNVYLRQYSPLTYFTLDLASSSCSNFSITTSNLISYVVQTDINQDGLSDNIINIAQNTCTLLNGNLPTKKQIVNPLAFITDKTEYVITSFIYQNVLSNTNYYLGKSLILNSTEYFNFNNVQNSILDLELWKNQDVLDIRGVNVLRMGTNNKIYGGSDIANKPNIITTSPMPNVIYNSTTPTSPTWYIIAYDRYFTIDNINFQLNGVGGYGLIGTTNIAIGERLTLLNNLIDYNFDSDDATPLIYTGAFFNVQGNTFDIGQQANQTIFAGGFSGVNQNLVSGGHVIKNNVFIGGGLIFKDLRATGTNYTNIIANNKFDKTSSVYSYPFSLISPSNFEKIDMNSSITYKTACDSYIFNIGNYYRDIDDQGGSICLDVNSDGLCDDNPFFRGLLVNSSNIYDYKTLYSYPYNFASHIGSEISHTPLCDAFNWVISSPESQTYTNSVIATNWEYISSSYSNLICTETINGENLIYNSVNSSQQKGMSWTLGTGQATFQVTCCNTANCDDFIKVSPIINFCVNNCSNIAPIITINNSILGCTNSSAINYNPLATQDNGSCIFGTNPNPTIYGTPINLIDSTSVSATGDNVVGFAGDMLNGISAVIIPLGVFFFIIIIILAIAVFLGA